MILCIGSIDLKGTVHAQNQTARVHFKLSFFVDALRAIVLQVWFPAGK
jgi:hypothetical protein